MLTAMILRNARRLDPLMIRSSGRSRSRFQRTGEPLWARALAVSHLVLWGATAAEPASTARVDFHRDVQPIFIKRCLECHGPDQQKSSFRLDHRDDAFRGGKSGKPAIIPGKVDASHLLERVTTSDADEVMPPKGGRLSPEQIGALRGWVEQGAEWTETDPRKHWAFVGPARSAVPKVRDSKWVRNEIDSFVLARLEKEGMGPSAEGDRSTLIRRLSLDLTGLPPSPGEVDAFLKDRRPGAYERLVERLLSSPHCGEQLARWWLDLARYADSNGYQVDLARSMWPYRDWVIRAFNADMPFDQFTVEQLAGDLLPNATLEQRVATGFHRNTKVNDEGGGDAEEYRTKAVKDRVATTATTWMGLTMMCAECHTHKYDPITQEDYYRFYGFFNSTSDAGNYSLEPSLAVPPASTETRLGYLRGRIARVRSEWAEVERRLPEEQADWERLMAGKTDVWVPLELTNAVSTGGAVFTNLPDHSVLSTGVNPIYDTILMESQTTLRGITAVLLEVLPDPSLPHQGPGRWDQTGNFILDEFSGWATPLAASAGATSPTGSTNLAFVRATADWEQEYYRAEHAMDRNPKTGWAIGPRFGERHFLIAELREPVGGVGGTKLGFRFDHYHGNSHTVGRVRLSVTTEPDARRLWPLAPEVTALLSVPPAQRTPEQRKSLAAHYRAVSPSLRRLERELLRLNKREAELANTRYTTLVMQELPQPRETYVHVRGNFLEKGPVVTPNVPGFLPGLNADGPTNRMALARWLVSPANPLAPRVTVNRLWERLFGVGLVKTSDDFGKQGEAPSHPELLDWLACEFRAPESRNGWEGGTGSPRPWDVKHMLRLMVTSATYRQSAAASDPLLEKDPENRLVTRGPRFRLDPEVIRDQALMVSGLLNAEIGGPSVYPVQVPNLWKEIGFLRPEIGMDEWPTSEGPDLYRRGLYTFWRRVCTYPMYATFDAPSREVCTARRPRTNTPLQALAALNEPTLVEAARVLAQRVMTEVPGDPAKRLEYAFRLCTARQPTKAERERLLRFLEQQVRGFEADPASALALVGAGTAERPANLDVKKLAAWMMVANVLLNLDETLSKG
jgi:mono/diheme cytochrome c family protein